MRVFYSDIMNNQITLPFKLLLLWLLCSSLLAWGQQRAAATVPIQAVDEVMADFMTKYNVPGAVVAISKDEQLVYAKGYGYADTARKEKMSPGYLFRIASISKPITAIAILKLVEERRLSLDQRVFGSDGILGTRYGTAPYAKDIFAITVRHLLQHTCGGWGNKNGKDPMFLHPTWPVDKLISYTLDSIPLEYTPGERYIYSNFGYCLLGRIIETVTMQTYENYVKNSVLTRLGIKSMRIGGNTLADRVPGETLYYGQQPGGLHPYIYNISRMDAHGGWLASAEDLMTLMAHVDGFSNKPDILSDETIQLMTTVANATDNTTYAYGWRVDGDGNWWHSGSLPGTGTHLKRMANGFNWTVLTNTRVTGGDFFTDLEKLLTAVVSDTTIVWPNPHGL